MQLFLVCGDPIQGHVLERVAERDGWGVTRASSLHDVGETYLTADAVLVDVEGVDAAVREGLRALAAIVGRDRIFLLHEELGAALPSPEDLGVRLTALKPVHPADLLRLIQAEVSDVSSRALSPAPVTDSTLA